MILPKIIARKKPSAPNAGIPNNLPVMSVVQTRLEPSADYDPNNDLLAVTGCIWACPYSTIVLDFSKPLQSQLPEHWLDVRSIVDPDDTRFDDIEFVRWEGSVLILRGSDVENGQWKEVRVSVDQLRQSLRNIVEKRGNTVD